MHRSRPLCVVYDPASAFGTHVCVFLTVYHLVGEMFLGAWASYTNQIMQLPDIEDSSPVVDQLPEISRLIFAHVPPSEVYDHAGLSGFFFNNSLSVLFASANCPLYSRARHFQSTSPMGVQRRVECTSRKPQAVSIRLDHYR